MPDRTPGARPLSVVFAQALDRTFEPRHHSGKAIVIELASSVFGAVIVRVAQWGSVRDHDRGVVVSTAIPTV
jgi:hypothetical protein